MFKMVLLNGRLIKSKTLIKINFRIIRKIVPIIALCPLKANKSLAPIITETFCRYSISSLTKFLTLSEGYPKSFPFEFHVWGNNSVRKKTNRIMDFYVETSIGTSIVGKNIKWSPINCFMKVFTSTFPKGVGRAKSPHLVFFFLLNFWKLIFNDSS